MTSKVFYRKQSKSLEYFIVRNFMNKTIFQIKKLDKKQMGDTAPKRKKLIKNGCFFISFINQNFQKHHPGRADQGSFREYKVLCKDIKISWET